MSAGLDETTARGGLRELQEAELRILDYTLDVCAELGLRWYILGGTLLGAVRHGGFIPWDDDIDLGLPRPDYDRLLAHIAAHAPAEFRLVRYTDGGKAMRYFAQIESSEIRVRMCGQLEKLERGVWIDIFPLDGMQGFAPARYLRAWRLMALRALAQLSQFDSIVNVKKRGRPLHERVLIFLGRRFGLGKGLDTRRVYDKMDAILKKRDYDKSAYVANIFGAYKLKEMMPKSWFGEGSEVTFEGRTLRAPARVHEALTRMYGDYMQPPPEDRRNWHEAEIVRGDGRDA